MNRIRDKGVASVVDLETDGAQPFVVTELIRGVTLRDELRDSGPMGFEDALTIAKSLKSTLEAVHGAGVIHRDLKPSNIILGEQCPVLIDFGIAQSDDDERLTATGLVSGTPGWVAPEVLRGDPPDEGSDWWAWSAVLLNMLTARPPYGLGGFEAVASRQHLNNPDLEGVYPQVAQVLKRALGPRAGRPTATDVLLELEAVDPQDVDSWDPQEQEPTLLAEPIDSVAAQTTVLPQQASMASQSDEMEATALIREELGEEVAQTSIMPVERNAVWDPRESVSEQPGEDFANEYVRAGGELAHQDQEVASLPLGAYPWNPPWAMGYSYKTVSGSPVLEVGLASLLALLPVLLQSLGALVAVGAVVVAQTVGLARTWRERRRVNAGTKRSGDNWLATLTAIPFAIRAALSVAFNTGVAGLILVAAWALYTLNAGGQAFENPLMSMLNGTNPLDVGASVAVVALLWASNLFAILMCRIGFGGWHMREGGRAITSTLLPNKMAQTLIGLAALASTIAVIFYLGA